MYSKRKCSQACRGHIKWKMTLFLHAMGKHQGKKIIKFTVTKKKGTPPQNRPLIWGLAKTRSLISVARCCHCWSSLLWKISTVKYWIQHYRGDDIYHVVTVVAVNHIRKIFFFLTGTCDVQPLVECLIYCLLLSSGYTTARITKIYGNQGVEKYTFSSVFVLQKWQSRDTLSI